MKGFMFKTVLVLSLLSLQAGAEIPNPKYRDLADNFASPPKTARPGVYWYFMDGNLSREGVTKDLEAMSRAGIGYVVFLEVNVGVPRGKVDFMGEEWIGIFRHIIDECERLDIQMILGIGPGWTGSGGPWVKGEQSMRHLVASSAIVRGGVRQTVKLEKPAPRRPYFGEGAFTPQMREDWLNYYEDVAVLAFPTPPGDGKIADIAEKAHYVRAPYSSAKGVKQYLPAPVKHPEGENAPGVDLRQVVDLTDRMQPDGSLTWEAPSGSWTVMRFGSRNNGAATRPAPLPGVGMECDKFDDRALEEHLKNFTDRVFSALGKRGKHFGGIKILHLDSWEMGAQNWTGRFREEFIKRRRYDPLPFYPVYEGVVMGNSDISERFLWDLRKTSQELVLGKHVNAVKRYARRRGMEISIEPYDMNPIADLELGVAADYPMGEFWSEGMGFNTSFAVIEGTSAAHLIGQPVVPAESFTAHKDAWRQYPGRMKNQTDWALAIGLNRLIFHTFQHQCLPDELVPGMTMGPYGVHWDRNQTWWPMVHAYHTYLTRCQYLSQQGRSVADVLYLVPESFPHVFRPPQSALDNAAGFMPDRKGYNFDGCPPSVLYSAKVKRGCVVLPSGASYRLLVLPDYGTMTPELLSKIRSLLRDGATVVGMPPQNSPSLTDYPNCDRRVSELAAEIWGASGEAARRVGKGRLIRCAGDDNLYPAYNVTAGLLAAQGVPPDFESESGSLRYMHRTAPSGDLYFVSNRTDVPSAARCSFRVSGRIPELWDAVTGERRRVAFQDDGERTSINLGFAPYQSRIVVFPVNGGLGTDASLYRLEDPVLEKRVDGEWLVTFKPRGKDAFAEKFARLEDWTKNANPEIKYYSGTASYELDFDMPEPQSPGRRYLNLGKVCNMAQVWLNGRDLGVVWTSPWRVEVTGALTAGVNRLRIDVVNLWPNRLIGDEQLPYDGPAGGRWPDWLLNGTPRPSGRSTFTAVRHYNAQSPLLESGLLGPVSVTSGP
ncbi:MAG: glycosyl hydrolase [Kiritimatiellae bacterium]|nr:glycosyl hydrolase [Kiritimatiellia bacterium]